MKQQLQIFIYIIIGLIITQSLEAQSIANYTTTRTIGASYSSISATGSSFGSWRNNGAYSQDDNRSEATNIGFDFWYNGDRYTQFNVSTNGYVDFSSSTADGGPTTGPYGYSNAAFTGNGSGTWLALAPFYDDMMAQGGTEALGNSIKYLLSGTAPNRVLTIEWINMAVYGNTSPSLNFQVKLYETTGVIEYIYGTMTQGTHNFSYTCGINAATLSNTPTTAQLKLQQTENTNTFSNGQQNNLSAMPANSSKLTFTPPPTTPASPIGTLTFSGVNQTEMTVNWTNWCTNEVGYVIYNSTDNINFNFVAQTAANATNYTASGLLPGTLYYWRMIAVTEGFLSAAVTGSQSTSAAGNKISITSGRWDQAGTWSPSGVPNAGDNVTIANGHTVQTRANMICNNLTVGQGSSGVLNVGRIGNNTSYNLTVNNNILVMPGGQLVVDNGSNTTQTVTVLGNITNNGTINFAPDGNSFADVTFNKNGNQTISGTGVNTFNNIILDMGTSINNTLEVTSSNFTPSNNFLTLNNGTFKLSTLNTTNITPFNNFVTIQNGTGFECNSSTATVNFPGGISLFGSLITRNGIVNVGDAANENIESNGGVFQLYGGAVNISGQYYSTNLNTLAKFTISGGTLTLPTVGSTSTTIAPFQINGAGSTFNMSGGTIVVQREGGTGAQDLGYTVIGISNSSVTGGTLQIGNSLTPAGQTMKINTSARVGALLVNSSNATAILNTNALTVTNNITIASGILNANNLNITLGGNWLNTGLFTPGTATVNFNGTNQSVTKTTGETFNHLTLSGTGTKTLGGAITTNGNLTIEPSAILDITTNNYTVNIKRNWTNNGSFLAQNGTVTFDGTIAQIIGGSSVTDFRNITLNNSAGASLSQAQNLIGTLTITTGTFNTNSQIFTLISNISNTARIATIPTGADINGNITMQRYIGAGATNWRFLTTATSGATIGDWVDDFIMSGFTGSQFPLWPTAANPWASIYYYNETALGIQDSGYVAVTNTTNTINPGQGVWVWSGDTITGTQAFTVDVTGPSNKGNINLPVTFTSSAGAAHDGWNMVGNPYPSTIDWDSPNWTKTRINSAIYIWNPQNQQFASYVFGIGTNGGSRYIASSQAFWVQANAASPVVTIRETCKSAVNQAFMRDAVANQQLLTFGIQKGTKHDEAILRFIEGSSDYFDADFDALKLASADTDVPYIALINENNDELSVNSYNLGRSITMPVKVLSSSNGLITMTFDKNNLTDLSCAILEDLQTGVKTNVITSNSYTFFHTSATDSARFLLHVWNNKTKDVINPTCFESTDAQIIAHTSGNGPWNFSLSNNNGTISTFNTTVDSNAIANLGAGTYYLQITDQSSTCASSMDTIIILNPAILVTGYNVTSPSSAIVNDGAIDYTTSGGVAPYSYYWSTTDTTEDLLNLNSGTYTVTVTDANGCSVNETIILDISTGVNTVFENGVLLIYPNPAKDWITVESKNLNNSVFTITTINGQLLMSEKLNSTKSTFSISSLSTGIYFYELRNENESSYKGKLVIVTK